MFNNLFRKSCCLLENVEKYGRAGQATDDNMPQEQCMLDNQYYKHTLAVCNVLLSSYVYLLYYEFIAVLYFRCRTAG